MHCRRREAFQNSKFKKSQKIFKKEILKNLKTQNKEKRINHYLAA
jgi:hypothetical protein